MSKLKELVEWMDKSWDKERKGLALAEWHNALLDKARSLLAEEQSDCKHAKELEESMTAAIKEKMAEQSHTPEQGLVEECGRCFGYGTVGGYNSDKVWEAGIRKCPICRGTGVAKSPLHTAKVDKDKEVEPLAVLAGRKGWFVVDQYVCKQGETSIGLRPMKKDGFAKVFHDNTYAACELKARQYLEQLPDRKGE